jgi:hypothetical protein
LGLLAPVVGWRLSLALSPGVRPRPLAAQATAMVLAPVEVQRLLAPS